MPETPAEALKTRLRAIIAGEIAEREQAAHDLDSVGQSARAAELRQQATRARRYL